MTESTPAPKKTYAEQVKEHVDRCQSKGKKWCMGDVVPFRKTKVSTDPTASEIRLYRLRSILAEYLAENPGPVPTGLLIRDCLKHLIITRESDTILRERILRLYDSTKEEIDNGLE
jgi:hypothetical protein